MQIRKADELRELADELINEEDKHLGHLKGKRKYFLFADAFKGKKALDYGKAEKPSGLPALLLGSGLPDYWMDLTGCDCFLVTINHSLWQLLKTEREKRQVLYHYLLRCSTDEEGRLEIRSVDFGMFSEEVRVWGEDLPNVRRLLDLLHKEGQEEMNFDSEATPASPAGDPFGDFNEPNEELLGLSHRAPLLIEGVLPALLPPLDENVIEGEFTDGSEDGFETPPAVATFLDRTRTEAYGASEADLLVPPTPGRRQRRISVREAEVAS